MYVVLKVDSGCFFKLVKAIRGNSALGRISIIIIMWSWWLARALPPCPSKLVGNCHNQVHLSSSHREPSNTSRYDLIRHSEIARLTNISTKSYSRLVTSPHSSSYIQFPVSNSTPPHYKKCTRIQNYPLLILAAIFLHIRRGFLD